MRELISVYSTKSGKDGMRIFRDGGRTFSWIGAYGAGSGHDFEHMLQTVNDQKSRRRGMTLTAGIEFEQSQGDQQ